MIISHKTRHFCSQKQIPPGEPDKPLIILLNKELDDLQQHFSVHPLCWQSWGVSITTRRFRDSVIYKSIQTAERPRTEALFPNSSLLDPDFLKLINSWGHLFLQVCDRTHILSAPGLLNDSNCQCWAHFSPQISWASSVWRLIPALTSPEQRSHKRSRPAALPGKWQWHRPAPGHEPEHFKTPF